MSALFFKLNELSGHVGCTVTVTPSCSDESKLELARNGFDHPPSKCLVLLDLRGGARTDPGLLDELLNCWAQGAMFERNHDDRPWLIWKRNRQYFQKPFMDV